MSLKWFSFIVLCAALMLCGCVSSGAPSQDAMDAANVTADRMFSSFNTGDYAAFSLNFSDAMRSGINESGFHAICGSLSEEYGRYLSRSPSPRAGTVQGYNVFLYDCQFERGNLTIQLTMNASDVWRVEGLFFR